MQTKSKLIPMVSVMALVVSGGAWAEEQIVKIGHSGPLSGANAFAGKDNENGIRLALEELNAKKVVIAGKTIKFELQSEDDQCDPKTGVNVAQKLVDSGIKYVMGPYCSGVAIPASRIYSEAGALQSNVATNPKVTQGGYKNLFRIVGSDAQVGASIATYAGQVMKVKTAAVIDDRTAFGQGLAEEFTRAAKGVGLNVVGQEFTTDKATDFFSILTNVKAKRVDVLFFGGYAPQGALMARQMKQLGITSKLLGGDTLCTATMGTLGGDAVGENVLCAQAGAILDKQANGPAFKERYMKRFNQDTDAYAVSFYDQTMFIAAAMQKSDSTDVEKVGAEMYKMTYKGVAGTYAYDSKGNVKQSQVTISTFKNGLPVPLMSY